MRFDDSFQINIGATSKFQRSLALIHLIRTGNTDEQWKAVANEMVNMLRLNEFKAEVYFNAFARVALNLLRLPSQHMKIGRVSTNLIYT